MPNLADTVTQIMAVGGLSFFDGNEFGGYGSSKYDGKSPQYRDRPPVRYFHVGNLPNTPLKNGNNNYIYDKSRKIRGP